MNRHDTIWATHRTAPRPQDVDAPHQDAHRLASDRTGTFLVLTALCVCTLPFLPRQTAAQTTGERDTTALSYEFLDLDDLRAMTDADGVPMLTFACFDPDDQLLWTRPFESIDAWCRYARNDPNLADQKTEQIGWAMSLGDEEIFWPLQALMYLCPAVRDTVAAIETRPLVFDRFARAWTAPHIEFTTGENLCHQPSGTVYWNPTLTRAYGAPVAWDTFPPLVGLAHELVHAWQRVVEYKQIYGPTLQIGAMKGENLARYAFYRKVPGNEWLRPRPGNRGVYLNGALAAYFEDMEWSEWWPGFEPVLDIFEEQ